MNWNAIGGEYAKDVYMPQLAAPRYALKGIDKLFGVSAARQKASTIAGQRENNQYGASQALPLPTGGLIYETGAPKPIHTGALPPEPSGTKDYEDFGPPPMFSPQGPAVAKDTMPSALPYNPAYDMAARENYDTQRGNIQSALAPMNSRNQDMLRQIDALRFNGKEDVAGAMVMAGLRGQVEDSLSRHDLENAKLQGALKPRDLDGMKQGFANQDLSSQALFKQKLPSEQAALEHTKAQTGKIFQDMEQEKPKAAMAGYMNNYLAEMKKEDRNAMMKSQLMGKQDGSAKDKLMHDMLMAAAEGKIKITPAMAEYGKTLGLDIPTEAPKKKGYFE